ncbi:MAG: PHP domain-containing protein [bacterium]
MNRWKTGLAGLLTLIVFWTAPFPSDAAVESRLRPYRGIIHIHSTYSTGELTPAEIVSKAKSAGIQIVVFTDHDLIRGKWGPPPFRDLFSLTRDIRPSVLKIGVDSYFDAIEKLQRDHPDMVIIPGIEVAPFYHVTGNPISSELNIHDWRRHLILVGMSRKAVKNLPVPGNGLNTRYFGYLLPGTLFFLIPAFFALTLLPFRGWARWIGSAVIVVGVMGAIDAHPFKSSPFSSYLGPQGARPYQEIINYAKAHGGFSLWAHQGSLLGDQKIRGGRVKTPPHAHLLKETAGYLGFDAVYEDNFTASRPGREWDKNLVGYLSAIRPKPVWGYGGLDFHSERELDGKKRLTDIQNVFMMDELSGDAFFRAFINGRFYVVRGYTPARLQMDYFRVSSNDGKTAGGYGDDLRFEGGPRVQFQVSTQDQSPVKVRAELIRMGQVIRIFEGKTPLKVDYADGDTIPFRRFYYRLDVKVTRDEHIVTNPVFVRR